MSAKRRKEKEKFIHSGRQRVKNPHLIKIYGVCINLKTRTNEQLAALLGHNMLDYQREALYRELAIRIKQERLNKIV